MSRLSYNYFAESTAMHELRFRDPGKKSGIAYEPANLDYDTSLTAVNNGNFSGNGHTTVAPSDTEHIFKAKWKPFWYLLEAFGYHVTPLANNIGFRILLSIYAAFTILINALLFGFTAFLIYMSCSEYGFFHFGTASDIITGLMPLQNLIGLIICVSCRHRHLALVKEMKIVDEQFRVRFNRSVRLGPKFFLLCVGVILASAIPFIIRLTEVVITGAPLDDPFVMIAWVAVPLLRVWLILPLMYYEVINSTIRQWFAQLNEIIRKDSNLQRNSLAFYYQQFLSITNVVVKLGIWLNPYLFFSLAISVILVCLTIYYVTQTKEAMAAMNFPENMNMNDTEVDIEQIFANQFKAAYTSVQIIIAATFIVLISVSGRKSNEEARNVLPIVLSLNPSTEEDRFTVIRFVQKMGTQYNWGCTIWRTFPIERSLLFTLLSTILAWSILLVNTASKGSCIPLAIVKELLNNDTGKLQLLESKLAEE